MKSWRGIGLMSGTSLDGVDLAYCEFSESDVSESDGSESDGKWSFELLIGETVPLDEKWVARLAYLDQVDARTYARTDVYWGHHLGRLVADFIQRHGIQPQFVASHGQTIFHEPDKNYTAQIGDGETMVSYLPCPLVSNLRNKDVAMGGQGAPLVPFGERMLWPEVRWFLNLGGIANLSRISRTGDSMAFDVTACNMAMNWLTRQLEPAVSFDRDGAIAAGGTLHEGLFAALEGLPYYQLSPPKSLGTEWFVSAVLPLLADESIPVADRLHTYARHLVGRLVADLSRYGAATGESGGDGPPGISGLEGEGVKTGTSGREVEGASLGGTATEPLLVTGGGAHNVYLMQCLRDAVTPLGIELVDCTKEVIDFKEAIVFAFLGLMTLTGRANTLPGVTGASQPVAGGSIHLPPTGGFSLLD